MNRPSKTEIAAEARRLQRSGIFSAQTAAEYFSMTVEQLDAIGGVMVTDECSNCGESTTDGHLYNGACLRVNAAELPAFQKTARGDW